MGEAASILPQSKTSRVFPIAPFGAIPIYGLPSFVRLLKPTLGAKEARERAPAVGVSSLLRHIAYPKFLKWASPSAGVFPRPFLGADFCLPYRDDSPSNLGPGRPRWR